MSMFRHRGPKTRRLIAHLQGRERSRPAGRPELDGKGFPGLFHKGAVVFTDTADFTTITLRDGILHFLMIFDRAVRSSEAVIARTGGRIVKVEGDSMLLHYPAAEAACRGVEGIEALLRRLNQGKPPNERVRFSYGIGYGDLLDLDEDLFGLEVNLASKLGEDMARPGEALLTPAAAAALDADMLRRVVPHRIVTFDRKAIPVQRLKLRRS